MNSIPRSAELTAFDLENFQRYDLVQVECSHCGQNFRRQKSAFLSNINRGRKSYCSASCSSKAKNARLNVGTQIVKCLNCGVDFSKRMNQIKRSPNHYCSRSCAVTCNNQMHPKRTLVSNSRITRSPFGKCEMCDSEITLKPHKSEKSGLFGRRRFCDDCLWQTRNTLLKQTKGELFATRKNWQCARSGIQDMARKIYAKSDKPKCCAECGYTLHFHVSHVRDVCDWPDEALIADINHIDNLVALCPTHHWEFDHGVLAKDKFK